MHSITINNCSAVLYKGNSAIAAHAGDFNSINEFIKNTAAAIGNCTVSGWHRLHLLLEKEKGAKSLNMKRK